MRPYGWGVWVIVEVPTFAGTSFDRLRMIGNQGLGVLRRALDEGPSWRQGRFTIRPYGRGREGGGLRRPFRGPGNVVDAGGQKDSRHQGSAGRQGEFGKEVQACHVIHTHQTAATTMPLSTGGRWGGGWDPRAAISYQIRKARCTILEVRVRTIAHKSSSNSPRTGSKESSHPELVEGSRLLAGSRGLGPKARLAGTDSDASTSLSMTFFITRLPWGAGLGSSLGVVDWVPRPAWQERIQMLRLRSA